MTNGGALTKFAIFTVVCLGFGAWLVFVIGNISLADRTTYKAEFADVTGLIVNDAVKISGVTIGKVSGIEVKPGGTALVTFEIDDDLPLPEDSGVAVRWRDVFGLRFLYILPGGDGPPVPPDHVFPLTQTDSPADLGGLLQRLVPVMSALAPEVQNQVLEALSEGLMGNEDEARALIDEGARLLEIVASRDEELGRLIANSATIIDGYASREAQLRGLLDQFAAVADELSARNDTIVGVLDEVAAAQDQLDTFVDNSDEEIKALLDEAQQLTGVLSQNRDNLDELVTTIGQGLFAYHFISRIGQWFNINAAGFSVNGETVETSRGARNPRDLEPQGGGNASLGGFFGAPAGGGR